MLALPRAMITFTRRGLLVSDLSGQGVGLLGGASVRRTARLDPVAPVTPIRHAALRQNRLRRHAANSCTLASGHTSLAISARCWWWVR